MLDYADRRPLLQRIDAEPPDKGQHFSQSLCYRRVDGGRPAYIGSQPGDIGGASERQLTPG
jgi:hypothetical protein